MKFKYALLGLGFAGMMSVATSAAQASTVYDYTFVSTDVGAPVTSMSGTFTTATPATPTGVDITGMTGTLVPFDTVVNVTGTSYPTVSFSPDGAFMYDNGLFSTQPYLDNNGVLFTTSNAPAGAYWNLFSTSTTTYGLYESIPGASYPGGPYAVSENGTLTVLALSAVPEPSTWAMMILGFLGVGFLSYRRKSAAGTFRLA